MTLPDDMTLAQLEQQIGSEISAYQPWLGIDVETGDWWDTTGKFEASDIEAMLSLDGRARAIEQALTLPLRAAPFTIKAGKGDTGEAELVEATLDAMIDTPLRQVIGQAAQSMIFRITYLEKCFEVTDAGQIGYRAIAWRPPDSCGLLRDRGTGAVTGFTQDLYGHGGPVRIMGPKAAVFIHGASRDPVRGVTEMAVSYRCFRDKQKLRALWMLLLERLGAPWIVARTDPGTENTVAQTLAKLRGGGVAAVSGVAGVDVLNVAGEVGQIFMDAVKFLDSEMAGSVLAGFLDLASSASRGAGSLALSQDQTDFYADSMDAAAREVAEGFKVKIATPIVRYNRGPAGVIPDVELGPISGATNQQLLTMLQALAASPSGPGLPGEFIDELVLRVAGTLDMDVDKIRAAIVEATAKAASSPAAAASAPVHAATEILTQAAANPDEFTGSTVIGIWDGDHFPKGDGELDLAAFHGHHIAGTAYHWFHGWNPRDVYTALQHGLTGRARELHRSGASFHNEEPPGFGGPHEVPHPSGHILGGAGTPGVPHAAGAGAPVSASAHVEATGAIGREVRASLDLIDSVHHDGGLNPLPFRTSTGQPYGRFSFPGSGHSDTIHVSTTTPHPRLTAVHEAGHWMDMRVLTAHEAMRPAAGGYRQQAESAARAAVNSVISPRAPVASRAWQKWARAVITSDAIATLAEMRANPHTDPTGAALAYPDHVAYLLKAEEMWARAYSQYIATRSRDGRMQRDVNNVLAGSTIDRYQQWRPNDFTAIAEAIDEILEEQGWRQ